MDLEQRTRTSQSFIYVECGPRPLPFAFPNSTSAESAFFVQVDYFRFARHPTTGHPTRHCPPGPTICGHELRSTTKGTKPSRFVCVGRKMPTLVTHQTEMPMMPPCILGSK
jgi:hypothetical protein